MTATMTQCIEAHRLKERIYDRVRFCIKYASEAIEPHADCIAIGPILLEMSRTQRKKLVNGGYVRASDDALARANADAEAKP